MRKANEALDKMAENARELGLDYEPAQPRAWFTIDELNAWADKKLKENPQWAEQPAQQEPVAWRNAALRVGEDLCSVGPFGYYDMTAEQWLDWALSVVTVHTPPAQREWVGLTKQEFNECVDGLEDLEDCWTAIEAKLMEKNT